MILILWILSVLLLVTILSIVLTAYKSIKSQEALDRFVMKRLSKEDYFLYKKWSGPNIVDTLMFKGEIK